MNLLQSLNEPQKQAVCHIQGPILILAGPGSGKTKVITHRIANLIANQISPKKILALTFTNKAAGEMSERVEKLVGTSGVWISTFHSFCAKMLYLEAPRLGYQPNFSIYDTDDQKRAIQQAILGYQNENPSGSEELILRDVWGKISNYKNQGMTYQNAISMTNEATAFIYQRYQRFLKDNNAMDFDDLILNMLQLLTDYTDVLEHYQERFQYILLDEFQDTNLPQYSIAQKLAGKYGNICATGDPDQSIYSWRGANISNILQFEKDFPGTKIVKLEQNYRSTKYILNAASHVIANNALRKEKDLWTQNPQGTPIRLMQTWDSEEEAFQVAQDIIKQNNKGISFNDMVVFYRVNSQSQNLENSFTRHRIPYILVGGLEFYERMEIKDILAYLRLIANENDNLALLRIIGVPSRGIGGKTLEKLNAFAQEQKISILQAMRKENIRKTLSSRARKNIEEFVNMIDEVRQYDGHDLGKLVSELLRLSGYLNYIRAMDINRDQSKEANIGQFLSFLIRQEKENQDHSLANFLQMILLYSNTDDKKNNEQPRVTLMTLHAAKGLEFPIVYMIGSNESYIPHFLSQTEEQIEEERRLFFVGITRAQKLLTISFSQQIARGREIFYCQPSRFLLEVPQSSCQWLYYRSHRPPNLWE